MKKAWLSFFSGEAWVANPLMLSPAMGCLLIFFIFPMIATVVVSFTDWELGGTNSVHFIGWDNYIGLWESDDFRKSVGNTLFMTMLVVPTSFVLSLLLALAVHASGRLAQFWQSIYFLPVTASLVAMAVVWQWILHPEVGIVAAVLPYFGITQLECRISALNRLHPNPSFRSFQGYVQATRQALQRRPAPRAASCPWRVPSNHP